jgi:hypothetical protein
MQHEEEINKKKLTKETEYNCEKMNVENNINSSEILP